MKFAPMSSFGRGLFLATAISLAFTAATASADESVKEAPENAVDQETPDPMEDINRVTSGFNRGVRTLILNPFAELYTKLLPPPVQESVSNVANNLSEPLTAVSSALQGDGENAGAAMERFFINSTVGLGGINDEATEMGVVARVEDLGQAAGKDGVGGGAHIVLPILGPSNLRDATGDVINFLVNPLSAATTVQKSISYAENKDAIEAMNKTAVDPYIAERDAYEQNRRYKIYNGSPPMANFTMDEEEGKGSKANQ